MSSPEVPLEQFILEPDTVEYVTLESSALLNLLNERGSNARLGPVLSGGFVIIYAKAENASLLLDEFGVVTFNIFPTVVGLMDLKNLEAAGIPRVQSSPFLDLSGRGVLIGFVDTGIDYTNDAFIYEDGTSKIQYLWDQTALGNAPDYYHFGAEYSKEQIDAALSSEDPHVIVPQQDTVGHGTFLASLAAGRPTAQNIGAAPDAELIVVKLTQARPFYYDRYLIPAAQQNAYLSTSVMQGVDYIYRKAQELNRPVVICLGLGSNYSGNDGFSLFEQYLNELSYHSKVCLCAAAGNESDARHHTQGIIEEQGGTQNVDIQVGDNGGNIYMTIWNTEADLFSVSLTSPAGERVGRVPAKPGSQYQTSLVLERSIITVQYLYPLESSGAQVTIVKIQNATPGIWTITLYGDIILDGSFHMWLPITGFIEPGITFLSPSPNFTIVSPATTFGVISCGAYNSQNNGLYTASSWGPTRTPKMSPDLTAPGVNVGAEYPDGHGTMTGTSVAAAMTTGASALMMQWGVVNGNDPSLNTSRIKSFLIRGCIRDPNTVYPNAQWGYGRLNLYNSFVLMQAT